MVKWKRDHLPRKQVEPVQLPFVPPLLASKVMSTGFTPFQCPFSNFIAHCSAPTVFFLFKGR
jgi:hypothetical protein